MVCGPSTPLPYARGTLVSGFSTAEATAQPCGEWGQIVSGAASAGLLCLGTDVRHEKGSPGASGKVRRAGDGHGVRMVTGRHKTLLTTGGLCAFHSSGP